MGGVYFTYHNIMRLLNLYTLTEANGSLTIFGKINCSGKKIFGITFEEEILSENCQLLSFKHFVNTILKSLYAYDHMLSVPTIY